MGSERPDPAAADGLRCPAHAAAAILLLLLLLRCVQWLLL
jgi:hypothetical protein